MRMYLSVPSTQASSVSVSMMLFSAIQTEVIINTCCRTAKIKYWWESPPTVSPPNKEAFHVVAAFSSGEGCRGEEAERGALKGRHIKQRMKAVCASAARSWAHLAARTLFLEASLDQTRAEPVPSWHFNQTHNASLTAPNNRGVQQKHSTAVSEAGIPWATGIRITSATTSSIDFIYQCLIQVTSLQLHMKPTKRVHIWNLSKSGMLCVNINTTFWVVYGYFIIYVLYISICTWTIAGFFS